MSDQRRMPSKIQVPKQEHPGGGIAPHLRKPGGTIPTGTHHEIAKNAVSDKGLGGGKAFKKNC